MNFVEPIRNADTLEAIEYHLKRDNERNYIMFMIGIHTGLRISDILKLKVSDIQNEAINIREEKTKKQRHIKLHGKLKKALYEYIDDLAATDYLIKSRVGNNKQLHRSSAYNVLKKLEKPFKLDNIGTHTMRKTFGYHYYKNTNNIAVLQRVFNHASPAVTLKYIGITQDDINAAIMDFKYYRG